MSLRTAMTSAGRPERDGSLNRKQQHCKQDDFSSKTESVERICIDISPEIAVPTHYGSIVGKKQDADVFRKNVKAGIRVEILL